MYFCSRRPFVASLGKVFLGTMRLRPTSPAWSSVLRNDPTSFESSFAFGQWFFRRSRSYQVLAVIISGSKIKQSKQTTVQSSVSNAIGIRIFTYLHIIYHNMHAKLALSWLKLTECHQQWQAGRPLSRKGSPSSAHPHGSRAWRW